MTRATRTKQRRRSTARTALTIGAVAATVAVVLLYVAFRAPYGIPGEPHYDISAQFSSLGTLGERGADVRIAGNLVGQVLNARLVDGVPTVDLQLHTSVRPLPADTTARIRPRGLLGAEYVDLVPGHAKQTLSDGAVIRSGRTSTAAQLSDVLSALDAPTRRSLADTVRGLGGGVAGRGVQLNGMLSLTAPVLEHLQGALAPLLGRAGATTRFIAGTEALTATLDPLRDEIVHGFAEGSAALEPLVQERASVSQLLDVAPGTLTGIRDLLARTDPVLAHLSSFADAATGFTALAPDALRSLAEVLVRGRTALRDAHAVLSLARQAAPPTIKLTNVLYPVLPRLRKLLDLLRNPASILGPYGCDLEGFAHDWRGFIGNGSKVQNGPLGPLAVLRVEIAAPGVEAANFVPGLPGTGQNASPAPCSKTGGAR